MLTHEVANAYTPWLKSVAYRKFNFVISNCAAIRLSSLRTQIASRFAIAQTICVAAILLNQSIQDASAANAAEFRAPSIQYEARGSRIDDANSFGGYRLLPGPPWAETGKFKNQGAAAEYLKQYMTTFVHPDETLPFATSVVEVPYDGISDKSALHQGGVTTGPRLRWPYTHDAYANFAPTHSAWCTSTPWWTYSHGSYSTGLREEFIDPPNMPPLIDAIVPTL